MGAGRPLGRAADCPCAAREADGPGWRAFADLVPTTGLREPFRCYAHPGDTRPSEVPELVWMQVLVALDLWLEGGCGVMQHPTRIDLPVKS